MTVRGLDISFIPPLSLFILVLLLSNEICGSLSLYTRNMSVLLEVFAPNVLSEGLCQAEDNPSRDVINEAEDKEKLDVKCCGMNHS